jgi:putative hydrolase of the HAD superfamily
MPSDREPVWLFDYDRTLYGPDDEHVFDGICQAIRHAVQERLQIDAATAEALRLRWATAYGATLTGMMREHHQDPEAFFDRVHADPVAARPQRNATLSERLRRLPGERHIFTNARSDWAQAGVEAIGASDAFARIFDLRFHQWQGKPDPQSYARVAAALGVDESRLIFLDDSLGNLVPAVERGWRCVWVHPPPGVSPPTGVERLECIDDVLTLVG